MATKISVQQHNPKLRGSQSYARYERYKSATTLDEMLELGGTRDDFDFDTQRGYIVVIGESERGASTDDGANVTVRTRSPDERDKVERLSPGERIMFRWDPPTGWLGATIKRQAKKAEAPKGASVNHCWLIETDDDGENMVVELRKDGYGVGLKWCAERPWRKAAAVWASLKRSTARTLDDACAQLDVKVLVALRDACAAAVKRKAQPATQPRAAAAAPPSSHSVSPSSRNEECVTGKKFLDDGRTWQVQRVEWDEASGCEVAHYFDVEVGDADCEFSSLREVRRWIEKSRPALAQRGDDDWHGPIFGHPRPSWPVRVRPHPKLSSQFGVFAADVTISRGEIVFIESLPLLAKVPNELVGSDRYIAWSPTAAQEAGGQTDLFLVVDDNLHTSMTYFVNSADSDGHTPNELDPDGRGPNVYLSIQRSTHGSAALATFRASRAIRAGEEVLWGYEFTAESSAPSKRSRPNQAALDALLAGRSPSDPPPPPSSPPANALATAAAKGLPSGWEVHSLRQSHYRVVAPGGETYNSLGAATAAIAAASDDGTADRPPSRKRAAEPISSSGTADRPLSRKRAAKPSSGTADRPPSRKRAAKPSSESVVEWAQCESCSQWRELPAGACPPTPTSRWYCHDIGERCPEFMSWEPERFVGVRVDEYFRSSGWYRGTVTTLSDGSSSIERDTVGVRGARAGPVEKGVFVVRFEDGTEARRTLAELRALLLHPKPNGDSASGGGVQRSAPRDRPALPAVASRWRGGSARCGTCAGCVASNCGRCAHCLDMPFFGGPGKVRQGCERRRCTLRSAFAMASAAQAHPAAATEVVRSLPEAPKPAT